MYVYLKPIQLLCIAYHLSFRFYVVQAFWRRLFLSLSIAYHVSSDTRYNFKELWLRSHIPPPIKSTVKYNGLTYVACNFREQYLGIVDIEVENILPIATNLFITDIMLWSSNWVG